MVVGWVTGESRLGGLGVVVGGKGLDKYIRLW